MSRLDDLEVCRRRVNDVCCGLPLHSQALVLELIDAEIARVKLPVVFRPIDDDPDCGRWLIGQPARAYAFNLIGLKAAWRAIKAFNDRTPAPRVADFSLAANSLRTAIRRTSANQVERQTRCLELVSALRGMSVKEGRVEYAPATDAPRFDTGPKG